jgi:hypothetical protein
MNGSSTTGSFEFVYNKFWEFLQLLERRYDITVSGYSYLFDHKTEKSKANTAPIPQAIFAYSAKESMTFIMIKVGLACKRGSILSSELIKSRSPIYGIAEEMDKVIYSNPRCSGVEDFMKRILVDLKLALDNLNSEIFWERFTTHDIKDRMHDLLHMIFKSLDFEPDHHEQAIMDELDELVNTFNNELSFLG